MLETFRSDLLNPGVLERALSKLEARLLLSQDAPQLAGLDAEAQSLRAEMARLTSALAAGGALSSLLSAIREREHRLEAIETERRRVCDSANVLDVPLEAIMTDVRRRLDEWQSVLLEESTQARRMLRMLLRGRLVFTPDLESHACDYVGEGDLSAIFRGLVNVPKALASPTGNSISYCELDGVMRRRKAA